MARLCCGWCKSAIGSVGHCNYKIPISGGYVNTCVVGNFMSRNCDLGWAIGRAFSPLDFYPVLFPGRCPGLG